eukprot:TRINITY_DN8752_c0_g1_i1.p1 TRINITY_DN8752_c0_g1~~TRINITY_DN8752_c0_g1_i1.p1  ORF type:complete len:516 (+),score=85.86 TRINITY_DN8752_c0_g1_i1:127-1674(+)
MSVQTMTSQAWLTLAVTAAAFFSFAAVMNLPFPFLVFMVRHFGQGSPDEAAVYAGIVASAFFLGGGLTSYMWGTVMDRYGRRPVVLSSLAALTIFTVLFGVVPSYPLAVLCRFCSGALNAIAVSSKAIVAEAVPPQHQARAMTMLTAAWGVGMIIGPMLGGLLSHPEEHYPSLDTPFIRRHPFSIPCILVAAITALSAALNYAYLPETLQPADDTSDDPDKEVLIKSVKSVTSRDSSPERDTPRKASIRALMSAKNSRVSLLLYAAFSFGCIGIEELHSVYCATPVAKGGLGWDSSNIGWSLAVVGGVLIASQMIIYPALERRFKITGAYRICLSFVLVATLAYPLVNMYARGVVEVEDANGGTTMAQANQSAEVWSMLLVTAATFKIFASGCFTSMNLLLSNAVPSHLRGAINGLAMTMAMFVRVIGPIVGGAIFSFSISHDYPWPFNHHLAFVFFAISFAAVFALIRQVPLALNTPPEYRSKTSDSPLSAKQKPAPAATDGSQWVQEPDDERP